MPALTELLIREIRDQGEVISFARFMELALYAPGLGYYETAARTPGRRGDFYTSVSVGCLFGELLAYQFSLWLDALTADGQSATGCQIVEAGSHDGRLAEDILNWLHRFRPDLAQRVTYTILEPSPARQAWQRQRLAARGEGVQWHSSWETVPPIRGIIFSNELLDAFPLRRFGWERGRQCWFEWGVAWADDRFSWTQLPCSAGDLAFNIGQPWGTLGAVPDELLTTLPDGYTIEICPRAVAWWQAAARSLAQGWLLAFDYGHPADDLFRAERTQGTLRAYAHHALAEDALANPGQQDLTAHVNFSALQEAGQAAGATHGSLTTQSQFFMQALAAITKNPAGFAPWTAARTRQFQTLTHPDFLGQSFKVLCQTKR